MGREGELVLVNGQARPTFTARPGERERWRIVNACAARYVRLRLDGQRAGPPGYRLRPLRRGAPRSTRSVLATGNRADLLVTATKGTSTLEALGVDRGGTGGMMGGSVSRDVGTLATFEVTGEDVVGTGTDPGAAGAP